MLTSGEQAQVAAALMAAGWSVFDAWWIAGLNNLSAVSE